jgi:hypothetical protein
MKDVFIQMGLFKSDHHIWNVVTWDTDMYEGVSKSFRTEL